MTIFRPCIDLHNGQVKQIVGGTLGAIPSELVTNFTSARPSTWFAELFKKDGLSGGHVIMLGPGNENAAIGALKAYPNGLQVGGGIHIGNAETWLNRGASHVIVTSWLIPNNAIDMERLKSLSQIVGPSRLVLDLSCRRADDAWYIAKNRWQTITKTPVTPNLLEELSEYCDEFLIHAADVEGRCEGIDHSLVQYLSQYTGKAITYAGGARALSDLSLVSQLSLGKIDLTIGSALDIFGGTLVKYKDCVTYNLTRSDDC